MVHRLGDLTLEAAAEQAAGNWQEFDSFAWFRQDDLESPENWAIHYTHHRDSGLLELSNAEVIAKKLEPFTHGDDPDVIPESHDHWLVGHIDGFSIRVFDTRRQITNAFKAYFEIAEALAEYPILDEEDFSRREYEATIENIADSAWQLKHEFNLPEDWEYAVFDWLSDHNPSEIESVGDHGAYPSEDAIRAAFDGLGYSSSQTISQD